MSNLFEADNIRLSARCAMLEEANIRLRKENIELRQDKEKLKENIREILEAPIIKFCVICEKEYEGTRATHYCPKCLSKIRSECAKNYHLNKLGHLAKEKVVEA